ncbi:hypothetical protein SNE510_28490 [Streptomyces sp. NE5-10]|nr:hypothetical protein SNE510_28490 [Streptomyces sp. NE5-10]
MRGSSARGSGGTARQRRGEGGEVVLATAPRGEPGGLDPDEPADLVDVRDGCPAHPGQVLGRFRGGDEHAGALAAPEEARTGQGAQGLPDRGAAETECLGRGGLADSSVPTGR